MIGYWDWLGTGGREQVVECTVPRRYRCCCRFLQAYTRAIAISDRSRRRSRSRSNAVGESAAAPHCGIIAPWATHLLVTGAGRRRTGIGGTERRGAERIGDTMLSVLASTRLICTNEYILRIGEIGKAGKTETRRCQQHMHAIEITSLRTLQDLT